MPLEVQGVEKKVKDEIVLRTWTDLPFGVIWRTAFVQSPRWVPRAALRITSPEGPYPKIIKIPSRHHGQRISVWAFMPPVNKLPNDRRVGCHLDLHGGSFYLGSPLEQAPFCAKIARERGLIVLSIDYSLGPFSQFPSALEDCEDVLCAVLDVKGETEAGRVLLNGLRSCMLPRAFNHRKSSRRMAADELQIDSTRLSFSGFSSGGNLALNMVLSIANDGVSWPCRIPKYCEPIPVLLFYPNFHQRELPADRPRPQGVGAPGRFAQSLDKALMPYYLPKEMRNHPRANPGLADPASIHPKARFFLVVSEFDTLKVQIDEWRETMDKAGGLPPVEVFRAPGTEHGFLNFPERMLKRQTFKTKRLVYVEMMRFWDRVAVEAGQPRNSELKAEQLPNVRA